jgi:hypothetical protein
MASAGAKRKREADDVGKADLELARKPLVKALQDALTTGRSRKLPYFGVVDGFIAYLAMHTEVLRDIRDTLANLLQRQHKAMVQLNQSRARSAEHTLPLWLICSTCGFAFDAKTTTIRQTLASMRRYLGSTQHTNRDMGIILRMTELYHHMDAGFEQYQILIRRTLPIMIASGIGEGKDELNELTWANLRTNRFVDCLALGRDRLELESIINSKMLLGVSDTTTSSPRATLLGDWNATQFQDFADECILTAASIAVSRCTAHRILCLIPQSAPLMQLARRPLLQSIDSMVQRIDHVQDVLKRGAVNPLESYRQHWAANVLPELQSRSQDSFGAYGSIDEDQKELSKPIAPAFATTNSLEGAFVYLARHAVLVAKGMIGDTFDAMRCDLQKTLEDGTLAPIWGGKFKQKIKENVESVLFQIEHSVRSALALEYKMAFDNVPENVGYINDAQQTVARFIQRGIRNSEKLRRVLVQFESTNTLDDLGNIDIKEIPDDHADMAKLWQEHTRLRLTLTLNRYPRIRDAFEALRRQLLILREGLAFDYETKFSEPAVEAFLNDAKLAQLPASDGVIEACTELLAPVISELTLVTEKHRGTVIASERMRANEVIKKFPFDAKVEPNGFDDMGRLLRFNGSPAAASEVIRKFNSMTMDEKHAQVLHVYAWVLNDTKESVSLKENKGDERTDGERALAESKWFLTGLRAAGRLQVSHELSRTMITSIPSLLSFCSLLFELLVRP